ncbi:hypothetical protein JR316_0008941 [Psilocybe cubensis]|uniref:Uncharacterized protein n=1 Tax=Psilocybe cubensis TaxID=181762 RepID=A0ACB8GSE1_PSICU|nr:hypothetical protein JR316_0008941 [Psilocybe cubensis]KAH9478486.1 hypothetical protein JR316_0008941 [Psilocybe cubensis]
MTAWDPRGEKKVKRTRGNPYERPSKGSGQYQTKPTQDIDHQELEDNPDDIVKFLEALQVGLPSNAAQVNTLVGSSQIYSTIAESRSLDDTTPASEDHNTLSADGQKGCDTLIERLPGSSTTSANSDGQTVNALRKGKQVNRTPITKLADSQPLTGLADESHFLAFEPIDILGDVSTELVWEPVNDDEQPLNSYKGIITLEQPPQQDQELVDVGTKILKATYRQIPEHVVEALAEDTGRQMAAIWDMEIGKNSTIDELESIVQTLLANVIRDSGMYLIGEIAQWEPTNPKEALPVPTTTGSLDTPDMEIDDDDILVRYAQEQEIRDRHLVSSFQEEQQEPEQIELNWIQEQERQLEEGCIYTTNLVVDILNAAASGELPGIVVQEEISQAQQFVDSATAFIHHTVTTNQGTVVEAVGTVRKYLVNKLQSASLRIEVSLAMEEQLPSAPMVSHPAYELHYQDPLLDSNMDEVSASATPTSTLPPRLIKPPSASAVEEPSKTLPLPEEVDNSFHKAHQNAGHDQNEVVRSDGNVEKEEETRIGEDALLCLVHPTLSNDVETSAGVDHGEGQSGLGHGVSAEDPPLEFVNTQPLGHGCLKASTTQATACPSSEPQGIDEH